MPLPPVEVSKQAVQALVDRWFPAHQVVIERMGEGVSTPVYRVVVDEDTYYLRLAEEPGEQRDAEVRVHELVRAAGVLVPEVVRWESEPLELDRSAALTSRIPGVPLGDLTGDLGEALRQAGRDIARINAIPVTGYGWVDLVVGDDRHLVAEHPTRLAWVAEYTAAMQTVREAKVLPSELDAVLAGVMRGWLDRPDNQAAHLAYGDFDVSHIYVDPETGAYQGLIDFGEIRGADVAYDLGHAMLQAGDDHGRAVFAAIVSGYAEIGHVDVGEIRLQAIAIATRALTIALGRPPSAYREFLTRRMAELLATAPGVF